jgi:hypothetical protein
MPILIEWVYVIYTRNDLAFFANAQVSFEENKTCPDIILNNLHFICKDQS